MSNARQVTLTGKRGEIIRPMCLRMRSTRRPFHTRRYIHVRSSATVAGPTGLIRVVQKAQRELQDQERRRRTIKQATLNKRQLAKEARSQLENQVVEEKKRRLTLEEKLRVAAEIEERERASQQRREAIDAQLTKHQEAHGRLQQQLIEEQKQRLALEEKLRIATEVEKKCHEEEDAVRRQRKAMEDEKKKFAERLKMKETEVKSIAQEAKRKAKEKFERELREKGAAAAAHAKELDALKQKITTMETNSEALSSKFLQVNKQLQDMTQLAAIYEEKLKGYAAYRNSTIVDDRLHMLANKIRERDGSQVRSHHGTEKDSMAQAAEVVVQEFARQQARFDNQTQGYVFKRHQKLSNMIQLWWEKRNGITNKVHVLDEMTDRDYQLFEQALQAIQRVLLDLEEGMRGSKPLWLGFADIDLS